MAIGCRIVPILLDGVAPSFADECPTPAERLVLVDGEPVAVCLWHSLVASERLGARFIKTLTIR